MFFTLCRWLARIALTIAVLSLILVVMVVGWQVYGRYVLNDTPVWAERVALLLMLYLCLLGAAVAVRDNTHLGMQWLIDKWSVKNRHNWTYVLHCLTFIFGAAMLVNGYGLTSTVWSHSVPTLGISEGLTYLPLVFSGALMMIFAVEHTLALVIGKAVAPTWAVSEPITE